MHVYVYIYLLWLLFYLKMSKWKEVGDVHEGGGVADTESPIWEMYPFWVPAPNMCSSHSFLGRCGCGSRHEIEQ